MSLELALEVLYEAAFHTDSRFRILDCNARAVEILRAESKESLLGRIATDIPSDHALAADFPTCLCERLTAVPFVVIECRVTRDDKSRFWAETVTHRLADGTHLITLRDISARVESLQRIEEANERLRALLRDRMEFVSNVSHELRTPLTSMSYALTNMQRGICGTLPEKATDYLKRLQVDVKRLLTTVNDLLDVRQMEHGTLTLHATLTPLHCLLESSASALRIQAEEKQQTLTVLPIERECYALIDRPKFERVFFNIFSNAVKYTPEGGTIVARLYRKDSTVFFEIDDNGIGIPKEALAHVSERYFRVGDHVSGTGLGLSIVREITELHQGALAIASPVPGTSCGTRITITLPESAPPEVYLITDTPAFTATWREVLWSSGQSIHTLSPNDVPQFSTAFTATSQFIIDGSLPESVITSIVCQLRRTQTTLQSPILILSDAMNPLMRRDFARWRALVRPQTISGEDLRTLLCF